MNTEIHPKPLMNQLPAAAGELARQAADVARETAHRATLAGKDASEAVGEVAVDATDAARETYQKLSSKVGEGVERTKEYAQHAVETTKDAACRATDVAKDMYESAALKAGDTLENSREYVRQNPVTVVLGAIAFGAAIGYLVMMARRKPTFGERYVEEPLASARGAILAALAPVAQRLHEGYDSARDGAGKAIDRVQHFKTGRAVDSLSDQIGRVGNNLKFW